MSKGLTCRQWQTDRQESAVLNCQPRETEKWYNGNGSNSQATSPHAKEEGQPGAIVKRLGGICQ